MALWSRGRRWFQSTLPRREWPFPSSFSSSSVSISIHTPTQGVTRILHMLPLFALISIHTPTQGVTTQMSYWPTRQILFQSTLPRREWLPLLSLLIPCLFYFNPHSHAGSDKLEHTEELDRLNFNPHSHAGSDIGTILHYDSLLSFQSTLPRREWRNLTNCNNSIVWFQSTLPRREWQYFKWFSRNGTNFNPHSHAGSDKKRRT